MIQVWPTPIYTNKNIMKTFNDYTARLGNGDFEKLKNYRWSLIT